ncbi:hypothetical protein LEP1GSC127_0602 [Leptospira kirschneri str. 200801925]|nr:hypothetical protein LEP1GSC127_0602 [Leptospira kirschneri str. 200801925]
MGTTTEFNNENTIELLKNYQLNRLLKNKRRFQSPAAKTKTRCLKSFLKLLMTSEVILNLLIPAKAFSMKILFY